MTPDKNVVLVTGSSGLIGSALIRRIGGRYGIVGFDREGPPHPPPQAECICVDLTKDESVRDAFLRVREGYGERLAAVVHLAAYYDFSGAPSPKYEEITVRGTERLLRELRAFQVERFVFSSTMLVHAPAKPRERINEDWPLGPTWEYPRSKVRTEELIRSERDAILTAVLRIAGVYDDRCHSPPLSHQIQRVYERHLTGRVYPGDLSAGQSFVHLDDLTDAIERVIERRNSLPAEAVILLGEPRTVSYGELQRELGCLVRGEEWRTRHVPKPLARAGAWLRNKLPWGKDPFIKPWMIDRADELRARHEPRPDPAGLGTRPLAARNSAPHGGSSPGRPGALLPREQAGARAKVEQGGMKTTDVVCGVEVAEGGPFKQRYGGTEYCFCSPECLRSFRQSPVIYTTLTPRAKSWPWFPL